MKKFGKNNENTVDLSLLEKHYTDMLNNLPNWFTGSWKEMLLLIAYT